MPKEQEEKKQTDKSKWPSEERFQQLLRNEALNFAPPIYQCQSVGIHTSVATAVPTVVTPNPVRLRKEVMSLLEKLESVSMAEAGYVYHINKAANIEVDPYRDKALSYIKASGALFGDLLEMGCGVESRIFEVSSDSHDVAVVTLVKFGFKGCTFTVRLWFDFFHPDHIQIQYPTGGGKTDKDWKNVSSFKEVAYALTCYLLDGLKVNQKGLSKIPLLHFSPKLQGNMAKYYYRKGL